MTSSTTLGQSKWLQGEVTPLGARYIDDDLIVGVEGGGTSFVVSIARRLDPFSVGRNGGLSQQQQFSCNLIYRLVVPIPRWDSPASVLWGYTEQGRIMGQFYLQLPRLIGVVLTF